MTRMCKILLLLFGAGGLAAITSVWLARYPFRTPQGAALNVVIGYYRSGGASFDTLLTGPIYLNVPTERKNFEVGFRHDLPSLRVPFRVLSDTSVFAHNLVAADFLKAIGGVWDIREMKPPFPRLFRSLRSGETLYWVGCETCRGWPCHSWFFAAVARLAGRYRASAFLGGGVE